MHQQGVSTLIFTIIIKNELHTRILFKRLMSISENFLNDWQAGFRPGRGYRDNITILRTLCEHLLQLGECLAVTFIDYAAAFDSLSHEYIHRVLGSS